jgi:hypothetical protein
MIPSHLAQPLIRPQLAAHEKLNFSVDNNSLISLSLAVGANTKALTMSAKRISSA